MLRGRTAAPPGRTAAVLGVWVLGALLHAVLARRSGPPLRLPVAAAVVARPDPPSPGPDLTAPVCSADIGRTARKAPVRPMEQSTLGKKRYIDITAFTRVPRRPLHRRLALVGAVAG
ncbi:hypothetical protein GCM10009576_082980 [Streptomyces rhizosphaericus]|uniref:Uncharacterized protein n=2 Tax=Streptomyces rhizosphaericus TaxID=114699 RepID=A0ABP4D4V8_9ACTN